MRGGKRKEGRKEGMEVFVSSWSRALACDRYSRSNLLFINFLPQHIVCYM